MSFAQLEEAARQSIEVDQEEDQATAGRSVRDKKGSVNRADKSKGASRGKAGGAPPQRDDEMQVYLSEIR